jgi:alpha-glucosidase
MGYDIRNYEDVYAPYGTLQDMEKLIDETHSRGMRIILDLVVNHTSDQVRMSLSRTLNTWASFLFGTFCSLLTKLTSTQQHAWFQESRSSKDNPKRDWYIWRPARYVNGERKPPNNWVGNFTGSVWQWECVLISPQLQIITFR